jgi:hypothetical protein
MLLLFWLAWRRQGGPPRPHTLDHLWRTHRHQSDATCEYLLHRYDRQVVRRWRHFQRQTLAGDDAGSSDAASSATLVL